MIWQIACAAIVSIAIVHMEDHVLFYLGRVWRGDRESGPNLAVESVWTGLILALVWAPVLL